MIHTLEQLERNLYTWKPDVGLESRRKHQGSEYRVLVPRVFCGFWMYRLRIDGESVVAYQHHIVAQYHHGPAEDRVCVHLSGNRLDNSPANLKWLEPHKAEKFAFLRGNRALKRNLAQFL